MRNKSILIGIFAVLLTNFIVQAFAANPDFSGTWLLDTAKSEGLPAGIKQN